MPDEQANKTAVATPGTPTQPAPAAAAPVPTPTATAIPSAPAIPEKIVAPADLLAAVREMDQAGYALDTITGLDWLAQGQMELVYDFFHPVKFDRAVIRARIPRDNAKIETISTIYPGANWHERETHDFFGIVFKGHPDLSPFLLPEDANFHPLRKDYTP